jgi:hypothetical protein
MQKIEREAEDLIITFFPILGAGLLILAIASAAFTYRFIQAASRTEGEVVKLSPSRAHPTIRFTPAGEPSTEFSGSGFINYGVGDRLTVLYVKDPESPSRYQTNIDTPGALWFFPLLLTWLGGGFILGGAYQKNERRKAKK